MPAKHTPDTGLAAEYTGNSKSLRDKPSGKTGRTAEQVCHGDKGPGESTRKMFQVLPRATQLWSTQPEEPRQQIRAYTERPVRMVGQGSARQHQGQGPGTHANHAPWLHPHAERVTEQIGGCLEEGAQEGPGFLGNGELQHLASTMAMRLHTAELARGWP